MKKILYGKTATGKTKKLIEKYIELTQKEGISSDRILVLLMNRNQSLSWRENIELNLSNKIIRTSFFGFIQQEITMFYPIVLKECPKIKKKATVPVFLNFEVSQYLLSKIIEKRREKGAFATLTAGDNKIAIDLSSNLVKAALSSLSYKEIGTRLYNSLEVKTEDKKEIYKMADKVSKDYIERCLECGVMDFAMALDLYNNILLNNKEYIEALRKRFDYLLVDNLEEAVPSQVDFIDKMSYVIPNIILAYNSEGGYGNIFGANRVYAEKKLVNKWEHEEIDGLPFTAKDSMVEFSDMLFDSITTGQTGTKKVKAKIKSFPEVMLRSQMLEDVTKYLGRLMKKGYKQNEIALISTFADPVTEYILESGLKKYNIELVNISRKNRFVDNKFVHALVTLGYICHPALDIVPNIDDVKALIMMLLDMDPVRSSILAKIVCNRTPFANFPQVNEENIVDKIGYVNIDKYEFISGWIEDYKNADKQSIDEFFRKVFTEILLVYNAEEEDIINIKRLIDSAKTFRETVERFNTIDTNKEFLRMIKNNVKSAETIFEMEENKDEDKVILATPITYLSNSLSHKVIVMLGLSSKNWLPRCVKELSNPYVLSPTWNEDDIYTEELEEKNQIENIAVIMRAILKRCSDTFVTFESRYSTDGYENDGILADRFKKML